MTRVYLSHGGADWATVRPAASHVTELGLIVLGWDPGGQEPLFAARGRDQLENANLTMVVLTRPLVASPIISAEIDRTLDAERGLVGLRMTPDIRVPTALFDAGAEVLDWASPQDLDYLPTAIARAEKSARVMASAVRLGTGSGSACGRAR